MPRLVRNNSYHILRKTDHSLNQEIEQFLAAGFFIDRDVIVGDQVANRCVDLHSDQSDFWFRSDGSYLVVPPEVVIIQVLEAEGGGELEVVPTGALEFWPELHRQKFQFGTDIHFIEASVVQRHIDKSIFRYRRDYMQPLNKAFDSVKMHSKIEAHLRKNITSLGSLSNGEILVLRNWRILHRRTPFLGRWVVRRIWLSRPESVFDRISKNLFRQESFI